MIHKVVPSEFKLVLSVVNDAAEAYKGVIPVDRWKEPHLTSEELWEEVEHGVDFHGYFENDRLGRLWVFSL